MEELSRLPQSLRQLALDRFHTPDPKEAKRLLDELTA
jgi:hypothetical protein